MTKPHLNHCRQLAELPEEVAGGRPDGHLAGGWQAGGACGGASVAAPV